jgi:hypothetical protein
MGHLPQVHNDVGNGLALCFVVGKGVGQCHGELVATYLQLMTRRKNDVESSFHGFEWHDSRGKSSKLVYRCMIRFKEYEGGRIFQAMDGSCTDVRLSRITRSCRIGTTNISHHLQGLV